MTKRASLFFALASLAISVAGPVALLAFVGGAGCGPKKPPASPTADQDFDSGADAKRSGATPIPINKVVTDEVGFDKGDMTDWKSVDLRGRPGILAVEVHWDAPEPSINVNVDVFDGFGTSLAGSPDPTAPQIKKLAVPIDKEGVYFIRVTAPRPHDASVYTIEAKWSGEDAPAPVAEVAPPPEEKRVHREHKEPRARKPKSARFDGEGGVQGRVVSSYREGDKTVLHIDKGSAAGVRAGLGGCLLDGASGATCLDGGDFTITSVIDESKSIGKTSLKSLGHNLRISINTGR